MKLFKSGSIFEIKALIFKSGVINWVAIIKFYIVSLRVLKKSLLTSIIFVWVLLGKFCKRFIILINKFTIRLKAN